VDPSPDRENELIPFRVRGPGESTIIRHVHSLLFHLISYRYRSISQSIGYLLSVAFPFFSNQLIVTVIRYFCHEGHG
jgi:hypothetical protein